MTAQSNVRTLWIVPELEITISVRNQNSTCTNHNSERLIHKFAHKTLAILPN